jgi:type I restriction enzyme S subunit
MDARALSDHFAFLVDSGNGVARLRESFLALAARGKLLPQDFNDEPASVLLARVRCERVQKLAAGEIANKRLSPVREGDVPFPVPASWEWVRLGEVCHDLGQCKPTKDFSYIDVAAIENQRGVIRPNIQVISAKNAPSRARKLVATGCVLYSTVRPYLLNVAVVEREFDPPPIASTAFGVLHPFSGVVSRFLFYYLRSPHFVRYVEGAMTGVAYPAINDAKLWNGLLPLPPTSEQLRIVAKLDQLMSLCDDLESREQRGDETRRRLNDAALDRLVTASDADELAAAWQRVRDNFDLLYAVPENVAKLRQAILQLAVQGKLASDGSTIAVVSMEELVGRANMKNGVSLRPSVDSPVRCLPISAMRNGLVDCSVGKPVPITRRQAEPFLVRKGDVFIVRGNGSKDLVGRAGLVQDEADGMIFPDLFIRTPLDLTTIDPQYFLIAWNSSTTRKEIESVARTTSGIWKVNQGQIASIRIPVPSLPIQKQIVARTHAVMALCDDLESKLKQRCDDRDRLAEAVVNSVLDGKRRRSSESKCAQGRVPKALPNGVQSRSRALFSGFSICNCCG